MDIQINDNCPRQARTDYPFLYYTLRKFALLFLILSTSIAFAQKTYHKSYYDNGNIEKQGWLNSNAKIDYWKFYYSNGKLKKEGSFLNDKPIKYWYFYTENGKKQQEGHYINGEKSKWWVFYDINEIVSLKCQFKNSVKNGYCLLYENKKLVKAVKYINDKKIKEWTDIEAFKRENKMSDLR